jgi:hypothetical protein
MVERYAHLSQKHKADVVESWFLSLPKIPLRYSLQRKSSPHKSFRARSSVERALALNTLKVPETRYGTGFSVLEIARSSLIKISFLNPFQAISLRHSLHFSAQVG